MNLLFNNLMDLHNHTSFSDGYLSMEELLENAQKIGIEIIGISDHYEYLNGIAPSISDYLQRLQNLKGDSIVILKGMEIMADTIMHLSLNNFDFIKDLDYIIVERMENLRDLNTMKLVLEYIDEAKQMYNKQLIVIAAHTRFENLLLRHAHNHNIIEEYLNILNIYNIVFEFNMAYHTNIIFNSIAIEKSIVSSLVSSDLIASIGSDTHSLYSKQIINFNKKIRTLLN